MFSIQRTNTDFPLLDLLDRSIPKTAFLIENAPNMQINCKNAYGSACRCHDLYRVCTKDYVHYYLIRPNMYLYSKYVVGFFS